MKMRLLVIRPDKFEELCNFEMEVEVDLPFLPVVGMHFELLPEINVFDVQALDYELKTGVLTIVFENTELEPIEAWLNAGWKRYTTKNT